MFRFLDSVWASMGLKTDEFQQSSARVRSGLQQLDREADQTGGGGQGGGRSRAADPRVQGAFAV